ncbi:hypothetical protein CWE02_14050 [Brucella pituitosa]|nr:hypothetical protein CWE02_14050 [Brucella pituitosa]
MLMYPKVHSAPVLEEHHFHLAISEISDDLTLSFHVLVKIFVFFACKESRKRDSVCIETRDQRPALNSRGCSRSLGFFKNG